MRNVIQQYARDLTAGLLDSGYEHSYRAYRLARQIGEGLDYDDEVLHAACFLHDTERLTDHPAGSARKAVAVLEETGFPPAKIAIVDEAIANHMPGGVSKSTEGRLLHDANLLDSIGAVGFARLTLGTLLWHRARSLSDLVRVIDEELAQVGALHFSRSREISQSRVEFLRRAVEQLRVELSP